MSDNDDEKLLHIGVARRSGRYEYGSGKDGYQSTSFIGQYENLKSQKLSPKEIAERLNMNSTELRTNITWARHEQKKALAYQVKKDFESGITNKSELARKYNTSEGTIRNVLSNKESHQSKQLETINKALVDGVKEHTYLDVGIGVELQIGVPRTRFDAVVNKMVQEDGYYTHNVLVSRLNDRDKPITVKVLTEEPDLAVVRSKENYTKIRTLEAWSTDNGETLTKLQNPVSINPDRVKVKYKEEGGEAKDGLIELRPGTPDLEMGSSHYAQVRIKIGDDRYIKGMAVFGDPKDFKPGVDIVFNTNKSKTVPKMEVFKAVKPNVQDPIEIFGSSITSQNKSKIINIVNKEGEWETWSNKLSSQFLSKQPIALIKDRLGATKKQLLDEYDEIDKINNPVVKNFLLEKYSDGLITKAAQLKAQGLPNTKSHVILPFPDMNPDEVYAPKYENGTRLVLIRHPHGGTFELPEVTVNNVSNTTAKKVMGNAPDAIGMHPSVAKKLSGADFDGDTVLAIPNKATGPQHIVTTKTRKELSDFDPMDYKVDHATITARHKQTEMGLASNLITDMHIKGATPAEIVKAVKHSMVVIDSEKHHLDYKQSSIDNNIKALKRKYQSHINPDTNKPTTAASTLISRAKNKIKIDDPDFDVDKYSSGTEVEKQYVNHVKDIQSIKNSVDSQIKSFKAPKYSREAARVYKEELKSLDEKLEKAKLNAPRERQAQILSNKLYYTNVYPDMTKDDKKKLRTRALARARDTVGTKGKEATLEVTPKEWEAIQSRAVTTSKLKEVLRYADIDKIKKYASPRVSKLSDAKLQRAQALIDKGYTYAEVSKDMGVSITSSMFNKEETS